jgi:hypothetical protein
MGSTADELKLIPTGTYFYRLIGQFSGDLLQFLPWRRDHAPFFHIRRNRNSYANIQVRTTDADSILSSLE